MLGRQSCTGRQLAGDDPAADAFDQPVGQLRPPLGMLDRLCPICHQAHRNTFGSQSEIAGT
jgi:hypothetical protein